MPQRTDGLPSLQSVVLDVLREATGPLTFDAILYEVVQRRPIAVADPKKALRNAIGQVELIKSTKDGYYAFVPNVLAGASFRLPLTAANVKTGRLRVGPEIVAALWPGTHYAPNPTEPAMTLPDGQTISPKVSLISSFAYELLLPEAFGDWFKTLRRDGHDALVLRCLDGNAGRFNLEGARTAEAGLVAVRNAEVLEIARRLFLFTKSIWPHTFALRLLARGAYHGEPQPDPLAKLLFDTDGRFIHSGIEIVFRPDLTPELLRFFADRLAYNRVEADLVQNALASPQPPFIGRRRLPEKRPRSRSTASLRLCYRFKVRLRWDRRVWRIIEILGDQTLEDLHEAIQKAFNWDNDHLYSFFLSGRAWDNLTVIPGPFDPPERPAADEVVIGDLPLQPKQQFLYLFDYGDELRHDVELLEVLPAPAGDDFPRIVERHGQAPRQYREWDD